MDFLVNYSPPGGGSCGGDFLPVGRARKNN
jgi:hypothetical protein